MRTLSFITLGASLLFPAVVYAQDDGVSQKQPLTRAQFIAEMDQQFQRFDGDSNGVVVAEEIAADQRRTVYGVALQQNRAIFQQLDRDANGALSPEEFALLVNENALQVDPAPVMAELDTDRDGSITLVEYRIATQGNFDRIDSDRDGVVTDAEMLAAGITPSS